MSSGKTYANTDLRIADYVESLFLPVDTILEAAKQRCRDASLPDISVNDMDGLHVEILALAAGAKKAVEIGTLGGISGIRIARALGEGGVLHTCELHERHAAVARANFEAAGLNDRIKLHVGPALASLETLSAEGPFDFIFVDADKTGYPAYAQWAASNLRVGGTLVADNTFAWGLVLQERIDNPDMAAAAKAIRTFNSYITSHPDFRATQLPTGEGLTVAVRTR